MNPGIPLMRHSGISSIIRHHRPVIYLELLDSVADPLLSCSLIKRAFVYLRLTSACNKKQFICCYPWKIVTFAVHPMNDGRYFE